MNQSVLLTLWLASGCAVKNHAYGTDLPAAHRPADGQAIVTLVRPSIMAFAVNYPVTINGQAQPALRAQRYIETIVAPGPVEVKAKGEKMCAVTFQAEADKAYFFKATTRMGWLYARVQLDAIHGTEAADHIATCSATSNDTAGPN